MIQSQAVRAEVAPWPQTSLKHLTLAKTLPQVTAELLEHETASSLPQLLQALHRREMRKVTCLPWLLPMVTMLAAETQSGLRGGARVLPEHPV